MFEDEASFWQDGTLHTTWAKVAAHPEVDTNGARNTAHVYGVVSVEEAPQFHYDFAPKFNGHTFFAFLMFVVRVMGEGVGGPRKIFMILDNGPCHNLKPEGQEWLAANKHRIELFRLPPYSPQYNGIEGCWKVTRRRATHNRFHATPEARDEALMEAFEHFKKVPAAVAGQVRRFLG